VPPLYDKPPIYDMPLVYNHSKRQVDKVRTLNNFLKRFLELMKDNATLSMLHGMICHCAKEKEIPIANKEVNQVHYKKRTNRDF
jgi:hypothetical protein